MLPRYFYTLCLLSLIKVTSFCLPAFAESECPTLTSEGGLFSLTRQLNIADQQFKEFRKASYSSTVQISKESPSATKIDLTMIVSTSQGGTLLAEVGLKPGEESWQPILLNYFQARPKRLRDAFGRQITVASVGAIHGTNGLFGIVYVTNPRANGTRRKRSPVGYSWEDFSIQFVTLDSSTLEIVQQECIPLASISQIQEIKGAAWFSELSSFREQFVSSTPLTVASEHRQGTSSCLDPKLACWPPYITEPGTLTPAKAIDSVDLLSFQDFGETLQQLIDVLNKRPIRPFSSRRGDTQIIRLSFNGPYDSLLIPRKWNKRLVSSLRQGVEELVAKPAPTEREVVKLRRIAEKLRNRALAAAALNPEDGIARE